MKPARFKYLRPASVEDALAALGEHADDGKLIAGGQSLVPMLNFRLLAPAVLIDINRLPGLNAATETPDGGLAIGALTRHQTLEWSDPVQRRFAVLHAAVKHIGHLAIRNRGTIGGSLSHADPTAELPLMSVLLDATLTAASASGSRTIAARDFFVGPLSTVLEPHEMLTRVDLPGLGEGAGWAFEEFARRCGDYAIAAVGVILRVAEGRIAEARIAIAGGGGGPMRATRAEESLAGRPIDDAALREAMLAADAEIDPVGDLQVSGEYRRHLIGVLIQRALRGAWQRAHGASA
jgi:CO/xanthine dehydrogenase FAD-binding subunit